MVQGCENCLDNFQHNFQSMKEEAEKKERKSPIHSEDRKTENFTTSNNPSVSLSPETTPRFSNNLKTLKEGLSVLEREFIKFRERTLVSLHQKTSNDQTKNETHTLILQQRDQIRELQQAMRELEEDNQSLRMMLRSIREEITSINQFRSRQALQEEDHHQPISPTSSCFTPTNPHTPSSSDVISTSKVNPPLPPNPPNLLNILYPSAFRPIHPSKALRNRHLC